MVITRPPQPNLSSSSLITLSISNPNPNPNFIPCHVHASPLSVRRRSIFISPATTVGLGRPRLFLPRSAFVEQLAGEAETEDSGDLAGVEAFDFKEVKPLGTPELEVKDLDELPEQWRRTKLAWLCKELPAHKSGTLVRILNGQRKWIRQDDATYLAVHCMRIRENETGFKVYQWMRQHNWYRFDFALATKLADYMGKERKFSKCREIFDDIIKQGRVPTESTFHVLIVAYLSVPVEGSLEEACGIYNRMIQLGGYKPRLSLHNSLFKAIISKPGSSATHYLKQAEFIFHNLVTTGLDIHKEIYSGLIWLHSYQETIDKERINELREEMKKAGFEESKEVLVSVLRACAKDGDLEEAEDTWARLVRLEGGIPSQAFDYRMKVFAKAGDIMKSLEIFRDMKKRLGSVNVISYHKIVEILCKAEEVELAELLMAEFIKSDLMPVTPAYIELMNMYFNLSLHDKVELAFSRCLEKCQPSRTVYSIYLDTLVETGKLIEAEEIFNEMQSNTAIGINTRSCNTILRGYLSSSEDTKAVEIYKMMRQKQYDVELDLKVKVDTILSSLKKGEQKPVTLRLSKEQREVLVGLLLGGLRIESDETRMNHMIRFEFNEKSGTHGMLKRCVHNLFHEWLHPFCQVNDENDDVPYKFFSIPSHHFGFYADQFWPINRPTIPKLIHRWLSPCSLAYWYMYGGYRTSSGDIVLKLKGSKVGVERVLQSLKMRSLSCRVKKKGRAYWIGFLGSDSASFWEIIEPYVLMELKDSLGPNGKGSEDESLKFESGSEPDDMASDHSENED